VGVGLIHYEIPDDIHRQAKAAAALRGVTLREFVTLAIVEAIERGDHEEDRR